MTPVMTLERKEEIRRTLADERVPCSVCGHDHEKRWDVTGHEYTRAIRVEDELLAALDERAPESESSSYIDNEGFPTEMAVMRRQLKAAREVVEAARKISPEAWETLRDLMGPSHPHTVGCRELREALDRHDEETE